MEHSLNAKVWVGGEAEYEDDAEKMFVDGASIETIENALDGFPDISELYFAHGFDADVVRHFENKINVVIEVTSLENVPDDLKGRVQVILRVPTWVNRVKKRGRDDISVVSLDSEERYETFWEGYKVYSGDDIQRWKESEPE